MGRTSILVPGVFLLVAASWRPTRAEDCCQTKTVRDAPEEVSELNGVYTLKTKEDTKPDPSCMDGCVYLRDNEEYCFVEKPKEEGATVVFEAATSPFFTGSSTSPMTPTGSTSTETTRSTSAAPTRSTSEGRPGSTSAGSTVAATTESVEALSQKASEASAAKAAAAAAISAAEETKAAAASVSSDLEKIEMSDFVSSRRKRQSETTTTYPTPSKCGDLKTAMDDITNALDGTNDATYNPTKAVAIVAILTVLEANNLDPACSQDDVDELETKKTSASSKAAEVVATQTNKIAAATEEFNAAVALISSINEALASQGATTVEAGTTAAAVATVSGGLTDAPTTTATETATTLSANPTTTVTDTSPGSGPTSTVAQTMTVTASSEAVSGSPGRRAALRE